MRVLKYAFAIAPAVLAASFVLADSRDSQPETAFVPLDLDSPARPAAEQPKAGIDQPKPGTTWSKAGTDWPKPETDTALKEVLENHGLGYWFDKPLLSHTKSRRDLVITSARDVDGKPHQVRIRPGTIGYFRADASVDEFTRQGGWYWACGDTAGKSRFDEPESGDWHGPAPKDSGPLIMVVYETDGTVRWYALRLDLRC